MLTLTPVAGFAVAFVLAFALTPVVCWYAKRNGLVDARSQRKVHLKEVPRLGGIAIAAGFYAPILVLALRSNLFEQRLYQQPLRVTALLAGGGFILALGLYDDIRGANALKKLSIQIPVAVFTWWAGIRIGSTATPTGIIWTMSPAVSLIATIGWLVAVMNAINLLDGLDGLASGVALQALVATAVCAWHREDPALALLALCLAGSVGGFLFHNFHPASIFMGDSGSLFLGYVLGAASIWSSQKTATILSFVLPAIILAVPLLDTSLAVWRRALTGRRIFSADMDHIHHRLIANGWGQTRTVMTLYAVSLVFSGLSVLLVFDGRTWLNWPVLLIAAVLALGFARWLGYLRPSAMSATTEMRRRNLELRNAVRELEQRLLADDSDEALSDALAQFEQAVRGGKRLPPPLSPPQRQRLGARRN